MRRMICLRNDAANMFIRIHQGRGQLVVTNLMSSPDSSLSVAIDGHMYTQG